MFLEVAIFVLLAVVRIDTQSDCTGLPDGPCCAGCHSYTLCEGGEGTTVDCPLPEWAYNELIGGCDAFEDTPPPCGNNHNCTGLPDNRYPDMTPGQECESFFTCSDGVSHGVTPCNPPNATEPPPLVWDYYQQSCNWRDQTPPPCGTEGVSPPPLF